TGRAGTCSGWGEGARAPVYWGQGPLHPERRGRYWGQGPLHPERRGRYWGQGPLHPGRLRPLKSRRLPRLALERWPAVRPPWSAAEVRLSRFGGDAGLYGAALLA